MSAGTVLIVEPNPGILIVARNVLARAGFRVLAAHDPLEGATLAERTRPHVVLIDSKLASPGILESISVAARGTPVILTIQKGRDAISLETLDHHPSEIVEIAEFVEKPFVPERLLSSVERALERWTEHTEPHPSSLEVKAALRADTDRYPFADLLQDTSSFDDADITKINPVFPPVLAERVRRLKMFLDREGVKLGEKELGACIRGLEEIYASRSEERMPTEHGNLAARGFVERMPVDQILQLASTVEGPARCRLTKDGTTIEIFYRGQDVLFARGVNMPEGFTLGRLLVVLGRVDARMVERTLETGAGFIGQRLVQAGVIDPEILTSALQRQTEELIYEAITWKSGEFAVFARTPLPREVVEAGTTTPVHHLLLEGMRRLDEWQRMMGEVGDFQTVLSRIEPPKPQILDALRPEDRRLLESVDGRRTIQELVMTARRPTFHAFRTLYTLAGQRLIVRATA